MEPVLIVRLSAMGDVLHALPAVAALRRNWPGTRLGWMVEERWVELLSARGLPPEAPRSPAKPLVDRVHTVNTRAWRRAPLSDQTWRELIASVREVRAAQYEVVADLQGLIKSALLARCSGAPRRVGFERTRERPAGLLYTSQVPAAGRHVIEQNLSLVSALTGQVAVFGPTAELLPRDPACESWCEAELARRDVRQFALLSPGAGWGAKAWPAERFAAVARALAQDGLRCLVNSGPGEKELAEAVESQSKGAAQAVTCSLGELVSLTRRARLFAGGDTGPMHLAGALGVPVVALFGPTDPERNGPYGVPARVLRSQSSVTSYSHRVRSDAGLLEITPEAVIQAARELLGGSA